jgi:ppGpp synthetase/RelA/SpoT-type nucleotidyltranferase
MALPSKRQMKALGQRLATSDALSPEDTAAFEAILGHYDERKAEARDRVESVVKATGIASRAGLTVTARTKTTLTLRQKLARTPGIGLPYVHDIAGIRVVGDLTLGDQDLLASAIREEFGGADETTLVDRRADPRQGYRAVHVIAHCVDVPVEIQIRTELQALWADIYERQADAWGRGIRYGDPPEPDPDGHTVARVTLLQTMISLSVDQLATIEQNRATYAAIDFTSYDNGVKALADARARGVDESSEPFQKLQAIIGPTLERREEIEKRIATAVGLARDALMKVATASDAL